MKSARRGRGGGGGGGVVVEKRRGVSVARAKETTGSSPATSLSIQLDSVSLLHPQPSSHSSSAGGGASRFYKPLEGEGEGLENGIVSSSAPEGGDDGGGGLMEGDCCILSQDFFCTPDYITPDGQQICNSFEFNKENFDCPKSPEKSTNVRNKRHRQEGFPVDSICTNLPCEQQKIELKVYPSESDKYAAAEPPSTISQKKVNYVSQSAVALRCQVMPPPCIRNPFSNEAVLMDLDLFGDKKSKTAGLPQPVVGGDGLSRYHTDFHEIEQIGFGNFSRVFKALKRIDGCMYAVKHSIRQLHQVTDRRRALMEVQALAALGYHENIVGYHTSWFENEKLYIQMELCDHSLSTSKAQAHTKGEILRVLYQIAKALQFIHERGIAHLDVKPENIYVKNGVYKLGDFGFATLTNRALPIEEGDARYMPLEILNEQYDHLDKVDIFSLGATTYELVRGSPLPDSGSQFLNLRDGKISLLPGYSMQFQNFLKAMMDPDPVRRPSAKEVVEHSIFDKVRLTQTQLVLF